MANPKTYILLVLFTLIGFDTFSQEQQNDTIKTDVIDVVKPYTPSISDAFKVKETPSLENNQSIEKKDVDYTIFSFPVASTFTPTKGKAATVEKAKSITLYNNYASLGFGSYTTILAKLYLNQSISRNQSISGYLSHHGSFTNIAETVLDSDFTKSKVNISYTNNARDLSYTLNSGFQLQTYNWYGLPEIYAIDADFANSLDVSHNFTNAHIDGNIDFEDGYINSANVLFRRFGDNQGSAENRFKASSIVDMPIANQYLNTTIYLDYLSGSFTRQYLLNQELKYSNIQVGISPTYTIKHDSLTVDLGVLVVYLNNIEESDNKFYIYPNISASYKLVNKAVIAFAGIKGQLLQNTYHQFSQHNPFVSPTLNIVPTNQQYKAFLGIKGNLSNTTSYTIGAEYISEKEKAVFKNNITGNDVASQPHYTFGNSFGVIYDDINTLTINGQLNIDVNRNFTLALKGEYFSYNANTQEEAWNLPDFKAQMFLDYQINKHWFAGVNLYVVGKRKDQISTIHLTNGLTTTIVNLDSFLDANVNVGYHINNHFTLYAKANNIAGSYNKWINYPTQGFQLIGGLTYKFDF